MDRAGYPTPRDVVDGPALIIRCWLDLLVPPTVVVFLGRKDHRRERAGFGEYAVAPVRRYEFSNPRMVDLQHDQ